MSDAQGGALAVQQAQDGGGSKKSWGRGGRGGRGGRAGGGRGGGRGRRGGPERDEKGKFKGQRVDRGTEDILSPCITVVKQNKKNDTAANPLGAGDLAVAPAQIAEDVRVLQELARFYVSAERTIDKKALDHLRIKATKCVPAFVTRDLDEVARVVRDLQLRKDKVLRAVTERLRSLPAHARADRFTSLSTGRAFDVQASSDETRIAFLRDDLVFAGQTIRSLVVGYHEALSDKALGRGASRLPLTGRGSRPSRASGAKGSGAFLVEVQFMEPNRLYLAYVAEKDSYDSRWVQVELREAGGAVLSASGPPSPEHGEMLVTLADRDTCAQVQDALLTFRRTSGSTSTARTSVGAGSRRSFA